MTDRTRAERWLPVVGYAGYYEVSNNGRVRSVDRTVTFVNGDRRFYPGQIRAPSLDGQGRPIVSLSRGGVGTTRKVHHLVLEAFVGLRPIGAECCHADDDPGNNWDYNLSWGSRSDNMNDRVRNGIHHKQRITRCPEKHKLIRPNLVSCSAMRGHRSCLACARARGYVQQAARHGRMLDFATEAQRYYRAIMGADAA